MKLAKEIHAHRPVSHGGPYSIKNPNSQILDFSSNVSPVGPPPSVKRHLRQNLDSLASYPDPDSKNMRKNLQRYTKIPSSHILAGNGAIEIIYNFCHVFLSRKKTLIPIPTFGEYEAAAKLNGGKIFFFKTMNLNDDINDFVKIIPKDGCVFLCNPNNPTGVLILKKNIKKILDTAEKRSSLVFVDECFIELVPDSDESVSGLVKKYDNLLVLRSLTKSFGLAGIRVGYALGSKDIIKTLDKIKIPWNVSGLGQRAADAALHDLSHIEKAKKTIRRESKFLRKEISKIDGFECHDAAANFILIKTKSKSKLIQKMLLKKNILVRDCSSFRGLDNNYIRIAVRTRDQNKRLIHAMKKI